MYFLLCRSQPDRTESALLLCDLLLVVPLMTRPVCLSASVLSCQLSGSDSPYSTWHLMPLQPPTHSSSSSTFSCSLCLLLFPVQLYCFDLIPFFTKLKRPLPRFPLLTFTLYPRYLVNGLSWWFLHVLAH